MIIYPTVLYIKQHSITGLKYFGKTTKKDPYKYNGSGVHWMRHIKKHGREYIVTLWVSEPYTESDIISEFALKFSKDNNIVESNDWANLMPENGLDGGCNGRIITAETRAKLSSRITSEETKAKQSAALKGKPKSEEHKAKLSAASTGRSKSEEHKAKMADAQKGKTASEETKAKMSAASTGRTHSDDSKAKMRKPKSEETKAKMSAAQKVRNTSDKTKVAAADHNT